MKFILSAMVLFSTTVFADTECIADLNDGSSMSISLSRTSGNRISLRSLDSGLTASCLESGSELLCRGNRGESIEISGQKSRISITDMSGETVRGQMACEEI